MNYVETALEAIQKSLEQDRLNRKAVQQLACFLVSYVGDDFFRELLERHPHEARRVALLEERGRELIVDLHLLLATPEDSAKKLLGMWIGRWRDYQSRECRLVFDSYNLDLGCPH